MYYAELDEDGIVKRVIAADANFIAKQPGIWQKTCMKGIASANYAAIGSRYNPAKNSFDSCTLEQKYKVEPAKNENGKSLYYKKILGPNKSDVEMCPIYQRSYYLECKVSKRKYISKRPPTILPPGVKD